LLFASREELEAFATENKLKFREDSSNASGKYLRNRIRHQLFPQVEKVSPQAKQSMLKSIGFLQEDALLLQQLLDEKKESLLLAKGTKTTISLTQLAQLNPLDVWLFYLLKDFNFQRKTTNDLALVLQNNQANACGKIFQSETHSLLIDRDDLILQQTKAETQQIEFLIRKDQREVKIPVHLHLGIETNNDHFIFENSPSIAYFNADKLQFPLHIRKWKKGDRFVPFGMKGSKLVSDFFIDSKMDRFTKENTWLLLSADIIIWIVGYRSSGEFRVGKNCTRILKVGLSD